MAGREARVHTLKVPRRVEFADTDAGGVMHFSRFFVYFESAEDALLRAAGTTFVPQIDGRAGGWPKVAASCEYLAPARYGDTLEIEIKVAAMTRRTISYAFTLRRGDDTIARGRTTSVCCAQTPEGRFQAVPIPASLASRLSVAPGMEGA